MLACVGEPCLTRSRSSYVQLDDSPSKFAGVMIGFVTVVGDSLLIDGSVGAIQNQNKIVLSIFGLHPLLCKRV